MKFQDSTLRWALTYAHKGFAIIPTETPTHQEYAVQSRFRLLEWPSIPSSDPATIASWYLRAPYAGIAVGLGPSGMLAVEITGEEGSATFGTLMDDHEDWFPWETASFEAGETRTLLYRAGGLCIDSDVELGPGVVARGAGHVILPPSQDNAGVFHQWDDPDDLTVSAPPQWLVEKLSPFVKVAA